jgi:hypothetical protein
LYFNLNAKFVFLTYGHSQTIVSDVNIFCLSIILKLYSGFLSIKFKKLDATVILVPSITDEFLSQVGHTIHHHLTLEVSQDELYASHTKSIESFDIVTQAQTIFCLSHHEKSFFILSKLFSISTTFNLFAFVSNKNDISFEYIKLSIE